MAGERILVVDDKPESIELLTEYLLRPNAYIPLIARDGKEGLRVALEQKPDLIILDHKMPKMTGLQVLKELRDRSQDIPVILMTAFGTESVIIEALRLGACDYITKPYGIDQMLQAIKKGLQSRRTLRRRDQAWDELQGRIKRLGSLYGMSVDKLLRMVVDSAAQLLDAEEAYLLLFDESSKELYLRAEKNLDDEVTRSLRIPVSDSIAGHVFRTGEPVLFNPVENNQMFKIKTGYLVHSMINVPLQVENRVIGVLGVSNKQRQELFSRADVELASSLAENAAIAIQNARQFVRLRSSLAQRMTELAAIQALNREFNRTPGGGQVVNMVLDKAIQATKADAGLIGLLENGHSTWKAQGYLEQTLKQTATIGWDTGIIGRVVATKQPALVPSVFADADWERVPAETRSVMAVPILRREMVIGVIYLHSIKPAAFSPNKLKFVVSLADYAVVALENIRLWNDVVEGQRKIEMVLRSMADGVFTVDRDMCIQSWNQAAEHITGLSKDQVLGKPCYQVLKLKDSSRPSLCDSGCPLRKAMEAGLIPLPESFERTISHRAGHEIIVSCSVAPLFDHIDQVIGAVAVFRDISSERLLERAKSEFISMISHQLRTPLTSIMTSSELLAEPDLDVALQTEMVDLIRSQCIVLSEFVDDIVNVAELESGKSSVNAGPISLETAILQAVERLQAGNPQRRFITRIPHDMASVQGDGKKLLTVLENLLDNAVKYSADDKPVLVEVLARPDEAVVRVIDQGIGIPEEQLARLFTWFYRGDGSNTQRVYGAGLGLYIAKKFIERQGGKIWVQSKVGQGSCFSFSLPWWKDTTHS